LQDADPSFEFRHCVGNAVLAMKAAAFLRAAAAIAVLSLMDAVIKAMAARYPTFQIAFLRFGFGLVVASSALAIARPGLPTRETLIANA
jgi:hypothetical protein